MVVVCGRVINELGAREGDFVTEEIAEIAVESYLSSPLARFSPDADISQTISTQDVESIEEIPSNE
jgi:hypothetical protein